MLNGAPWMRSATRDFFSRPLMQPRAPSAAGTPKTLKPATRGTP